MTRALPIFALALLLGCRPSEAPCTLNTTQVDFGEVEVDPRGGSSRLVIVKNPSDLDRVITARPVSAPFSIAAPEKPGVPITLQAQSQVSFNVNFTPVDGRLHLDELVLESDGSCDFKVPLKGLGSGTILAEPELLDFTLAAGQRETRTVLIRNTRRVAVTVGVSWLERLPQLTITDGVTEIPAGGSDSVRVTAAPAGWDPVRAFLMISSRGQVLTTDVTITPTSPRIEVAPLEHNIPLVPIGHYAERSFRVTNTGASGDPNVPPLQLSRIPESHASDSADTDVTVPWPDHHLAEGESREFTVRIHPSTTGPKRYLFLVNPSEPFLDLIELTVTTVASVLPACRMQITPTGVLQLQDSNDGGVEGNVVFTNTGATRCIVDNLRLSSATSREYTIVEGGAAQVLVAGGAVHQVRIAGPRPADAGVVGALGFHVFRDGGADEWIDLRAP